MVKTEMHEWKPHMSDYMTERFNQGYRKEKWKNVGEDGGDHGLLHVKKTDNKINGR